MGKSSAYNREIEFENNYAVQSDILNNLKRFLG